MGRVDLTFVEWLSTSRRFDGDKSLLPNIRTKLELHLGMPTNAGQQPVGDPTRLEDIERAERIAGLVDQGVLPKLVDRLRKLKWPNDLRKAEGTLPERTIGSIRTRALKMQAPMALLSSKDQAERSSTAFKDLSRLLEEISGRLRSLDEACRSHEQRQWFGALDQDRQIVHRLLNAPRQEIEDGDAPVEDGSVLADTLTVLHGVGRKILHDQRLNMGMQPLEIFCACYMKGEVEAKQAYPRYQSWLDATAACIVENCDGHEWMREPNALRNLTRIACWGAMFEDGRNKQSRLDYYRRWLHAALRVEARVDSRLRRTHDDQPKGEVWLFELYAGWGQLDDDDKVRLSPPVPFSSVWAKLRSRQEAVPDEQEDEFVQFDWPLKAEINIDELAKERREAGKVPISTATRWSMTEALPSTWINRLNALSCIVRQAYPEKWTVALTSKLGYFAVLPANERDEPVLPEDESPKARASVPIDLRRALKNRLERMAILRGIRLDGVFVARLALDVEGAIDVHASQDRYRSKSRGMRGQPGRWMYGRRYAKYLTETVDLVRLDAPACDFALDLYCAAIHQDTPKQTRSRTFQYLAGHAEDDEHFKQIWNTWVTREPVDPDAVRNGA